MTHYFMYNSPKIFQEVAKNFFLNIFGLHIYITNATKLFHLLAWLTITRQISKFKYLYVSYQSSFKLINYKRCFIDHKNDNNAYN